MTIRPVFIGAVLALAACSPEATVSPNLEPVYARGGGGQGGGSTEILPVQLGNLKTLGCRSTQATAINDAPQTMIGGSCSHSTVDPLMWTNGVASVVRDTGEVFDITASGAMVGRRNFRPFYRGAGGPSVYLPMTTGMKWGEVSGITPAGTFAVGYMSGDTNSSGALWTLSGGTWTVEEFSGDLWGVSASGTMLVGAQNQHATAWTNSGAWTPTTLPDGGALRSVARAVNQTGTVIVGVRWIPLPSDPSVEFDQHVAWIADGSGNWTLQVLQGLNILEGEAAGVATQTDGSVVAVGKSWEDNAGSGGEQLWAVAWRKPAGASAFNAPIKLSPVSSRQTAGALDVNSKGEIVGYSFTKVTTVAVRWKLP